MRFPRMETLPVYSEGQEVILCRPSVAPLQDQTARILSVDYVGEHIRKYTVLVTSGEMEGSVWHFTEIPPYPGMIAKEA
ncbi:MAG: hypothetical protein CW346_19595 [Bacillaceae bacterium]|nr:hypothetical protein [Bacillaceae bacterium]